MSSECRAKRRHPSPDASANMGRKAKSRQPDGERVRRKFTAWEADRPTPDGPSSLDVLLQWLATSRNAARWQDKRESRKTLVAEALQALRARGFAHRELGDVRYKLSYLENKFQEAAALLRDKQQTEAFVRGQADSDVQKAVLRICPQYRELLPVFVEAETAGKWKESLEKGRANGAAETVNAHEGAGEKDAAAGEGVYGAGEGEKVAEENGDGEGSDKVETVEETGETEKGDGVVEEVVEQEEQGGDKDVDGAESKEAQDDESEEGKAPEEEDSEDETVPQTQKHSDSDETSSGEEDSEASEFSQDEESEVEAIQLAQPDEEEEEEEDAEDEKEEMQVGASGDNTEDFDGNDEEEGSEGNEQLGEEDEGEDVASDGEQRSANAEGTGEGADSSSNDSEDADNEAEDDITPKKVTIDHGEESELESQNEDDDASGMEEDAELVKQDSSDAEHAAEQRAPRKRSSPATVSAPTAKRSRGDSNARNATLDLEREAFIERAKQEKAQRQELFELERAKLECELEAKRVQLMLEKSLARKKLLGAGVDPAEVDRVLPL
ncbi:unnamed protein product [Phytophthora lilii]|uniref:Unnamed protein product n=1 Tax=Phytophthora lilii TaxID=2077276 RepID=A0A9W6TG98_9STRA|nr:unnamed protein product [Phytophthora lilii]